MSDPVKPTLDQMRSYWPPFNRFVCRLRSDRDRDLIERVCAGHLTAVEEHVDPKTDELVAIAFCFSGVQAETVAAQFFKRFAYKLQDFALSEGARVGINVETEPYAFAPNGTVVRNKGGMTH